MIEEPSPYLPRRAARRLGSYFQIRPYNFSRTYRFDSSNPIAIPNIFPPSGHAQKERPCLVVFSPRLFKAPAILFPPRLRRAWDLAEPGKNSPPVGYEPRRS